MITYLGSAATFSLYADDLGNTAYDSCSKADKRTESVCTKDGRKY